MNYAGRQVIPSFNYTGREKVFPNIGVCDGDG